MRTIVNSKIDRPKPINRKPINEYLLSLRGSRDSRILYKYDPFKKKNPKFKG